MYDDYYIDLQVDFFKENNPYQPQRIKTKKDAYFAFESSILHRIQYKFSDYCREGKCYKNIPGLKDAYFWMVQQNPYTFRYSYKWLMKNWNDRYLSWSSGKDWATDDSKGRFIIERFIEEELLPNARKYYQKDVDKPKPVFVLEKPEMLVIEPKKEEVIRGKGRPKGSLNKNEVQMIMPIHKVDEESLVPALQDIIWYSEGLLAKDIIKYIDADEKLIKKAYAKLHEYSGNLWNKKTTGITNSGAKIERFYPNNKRTGYYWKGTLLSLSELSRVTGMAKQTLSYRLQKGMNHIQAVNTNVNENMKRK